MSTPAKRKIVSLTSTSAIRYGVWRVRIDGRREPFGVHMAESAERAIEQARKAYGPTARYWRFEAIPK